MKKCSVIVPCYNVEQYIDECISSLMGQTLPGESLELIFVDDASTDSTLKHLQAWEQKYPNRIIVIICEENGRQGTARNIGMKYASGDYIGFVDADDWVEPEMFQEMLKKAEEYNCDIVSCRYYRNMADGRSIPDELDDEDTYISVDKTAAEGGVWPEMFYGGIWHRIFRRSMIVDNDIAFPEKLAYEDNYFNIMVSMYCKSIYKIEKCFYHYRENPLSTTLSRNQYRQFDRLDVQILELKKFREMGVFQHFRDEIEYRFLELYYFNTMFIMAVRFDVPDFSIFLRMKREILEWFPEYEKNPKILRENNQLWNVLLQLLSLEMNEQQFLRVMKVYAELPR